MWSMSIASEMFSYGATALTKIKLTPTSKNGLQGSPPGPPRHSAATPAVCGSIGKRTFSCVHSCCICHSRMLLFVMRLSCHGYLPHVIQWSQCQWHWQIPFKEGHSMLSGCCRHSYRKPWYCSSYCIADHYGRAGSSGFSECRLTTSQPRIHGKFCPRTEFMPWGAFLTKIDA